jgi:membrane protein implicated in regulation of membrane protease activity
MSGMPWWGWIVAAGVLALSELHVPGSYLIWIALGAAVAGAADAAFDLSLAGQIAGFTAASAVSCLAGYFVYRKLGRRRRRELRLNERNLALVGARGTVCEAFVNGHGKVRLGDGVWLAAGPDLAEGTAVVVSAVHGTRLFVEAAMPLPTTEPPQTAPAI